MGLRALACLLAAAAGLPLLAGCTPAGRHMLLSTLLDGYPSLPPAEQYCTQLSVQAPKESASGNAKSDAQAGNAPSRHEPYATKACNNCHDKTKPDGLKLPAQELCLDCHTDFFQGALIHGPVAVRECLACHLPHSASYPSLLKASRSDICGVCHKESRLSEGMHRNFKEKGLPCVECHDPHFSNAQFLMK